MELSEFIDNFSKTNAMTPLRQQEVRHLVAGLSALDQEESKRIVYSIISSTRHKKIINNALESYASGFGKQIISIYGQQIKKYFPEDFSLLGKRRMSLGCGHIDNWPDLAYCKKEFLLRSAMAGEFSYIKKNLLRLFPGRVDIAKKLMFYLNSLTADETILLFEYIKILLTDELNNVENLLEAIKIFRWMRLDEEIEIDVTPRLNRFMSWICQDRNGNIENIQFKIIFLHNLLVASRICEFTEYIRQSPIDQNEDILFISCLENSIIDHLFFISNDHLHLENIFSFNNTELDFSLEKLKYILSVIDCSSIEISFRKSNKKNKRVLSENNLHENHIKDTMLGETFFSNELMSHVDVGMYEKWIEDVSLSVVRKNSINLRPNQQTFRSAVLDRYGARCSVCSIDIVELVEAAHIISKKDKGVDAPENGLPLCVLHHKAYDVNLFCIHPGTLSVVTLPMGPDLEQLLITKTSICDLKFHPHPDVLAWRWNNWLNYGKDRAGEDFAAQVAPQAYNGSVR